MEQLSILPLHYVVCEIRYVKSGKKNFDYVGVQFLPTPFKSQIVANNHIAEIINNRKKIKKSISEKYEYSIMPIHITSNE